MDEGKEAGVFENNGLGRKKAGTIRVNIDDEGRA